MEYSLFLQQRPLGSYETQFRKITSITIKIREKKYIKINFNRVSVSCSFVELTFICRGPQKSHKIIIVTLLTLENKLSTVSAVVDSRDFFIFVLFVNIIMFKKVRRYLVNLVYCKFNEVQPIYISLWKTNINIAKSNHRRPQLKIIRSIRVVLEYPFKPTSKKQDVLNIMISFCGKEEPQQWFH